MTKEQYLELFKALQDDANKSRFISDTSEIYYSGVAWAYSNVLNLVKHEKVAEMVYNNLVKKGGVETESS